MTRIYLVRHAEAEGNLYRRAHGMYNSLITLKGYRQIELLQKRFENISIDRVYSSPLFRTRTTAGAVYVPKHLELHTLLDLREICVGAWEDKTWGEIAKEDGQQLYDFNNHLERFQIASGETALEVQERMLGAMRTIVSQCPDMNVAVFSHGMAIRLLIGALLEIPLCELGEKVLHGDNTAVSLLEFEGEKARVVFSNDNSHLTQGASTFETQHWWNPEKKAADVSLRFEPIDLTKNKELYLACRKDAWLSSHGTMEHFDEALFLRQAMENYASCNGAVIAAYDGDTFAGMLELNVECEKELGVGRIPFIYLSAEYRHRGIGVQIIGEAVSRYREMNRTILRLRCGESNTSAHIFYTRYGFYKVGREENSGVKVDVLEKNISVPRSAELDAQ